MANKKPTFIEIYSRIWKAIAGGYYYAVKGMANVQDISIIEDKETHLSDMIFNSQILTVSNALFLSKENYHTLVQKIMRKNKTIVFIKVVHVDDYEAPPFSSTSHFYININNVLFVNPINNEDLKFIEPHIEGIKSQVQWFYGDQVNYDYSTQTVEEIMGQNKKKNIELNRFELMDLE